MKTEALRHPRVLGGEQFVCVCVCWEDLCATVACLPPPQRGRINKR